MKRCDLCDNEYDDEDMCEESDIEEAGLDWCADSICKFCLEEKLEEQSLDEMYRDMQSEYYREEYGDDMFGTMISSGDD